MQAGQLRKDLISGVSTATQTETKHVFAYLKCLNL